MNVWFPGGFSYEDEAFRHHIVAGGYATVGAASFTGAVTHTISISVIVFEMTGQITHIIPILIAVLISNAIAALLQPSCYDSIILIKKLPYLPDILPSSSKAYNVYVEDFMLREIKYIWYGMSYKQLRDVLKGGKKLRAFPLVDNPNSMVLLGSIQRAELIASIELLIGKERRKEVCVQRYGFKLKQMQIEEQRKIQQKIDEQSRARQQQEEEEKNKLITIEPAPKSRRPSRFEVTTVAKEEDSKTTPQPNGEASDQKPNTSQLEERRPSFLDSLGIDPNSPAMKALIQLSTKPKKSILKKSNSYTIHSFGIPGLSSGTPRATFTDETSWKQRYQPSPGPTFSDTARNYRTVTGAENSKWKSALDNLGNMFKRTSSTNIHERTIDVMAMAAATASGQDVTDYMGSYPATDMTLEEQHEWEEEEMSSIVEFDLIHIDPAPFQLVEKTSLLKVHSLFSMVGVNHAYVTAIGRLIGVVGLKELRAGIENANAGNMPISTSNNSSPQKSDSSGPKIEIEDIEAAKSKENNEEKNSDEDDETDYSDTEMLPPPQPKVTTPRKKSSDVTNKRKTSV